MKKLLFILIVLLPFLAKAQEDRVYRLDAFPGGVKIGTHIISVDANGKLLIDGVVSSSTAVINLVNSLTNSTTSAPSSNAVLQAITASQATTLQAAKAKVDSAGTVTQSLISTVKTTTDLTSNTNPLPAATTSTLVTAGKTTAIQAAKAHSDSATTAINSVVVGQGTTLATHTSSIAANTTAINAANASVSNLNSTVAAILPTTDITSTTKPLPAAKTNALTLAAQLTAINSSLITMKFKIDSVSAKLRQNISDTTKNIGFDYNPVYFAKSASGALDFVPSSISGGSGSGSTIIVPTYSNITATSLTATWPNPGNYFNKLIQSATPDLLTNPVTVYSGTGTTYNVTGLTAGTQYFFGVQPVYASMATTAAAGVTVGSTTVSAGVVTQNSAIINWTAAQNALLYEVYTNLNADFSDQAVLVNGSVNALTYNIPNLLAGTTYYASVVPKNGTVYGGKASTTVTTAATSYTTLIDFNFATATLNNQEVGGTTTDGKPVAFYAQNHTGVSILNGYIKFDGATSSFPAIYMGNGGFPTNTTYKVTIYNFTPAGDFNPEIENGSLNVTKTQVGANYVFTITSGSGGSNMTLTNYGQPFSASELKIEKQN